MTEVIFSSENTFSSRIIPSGSRKVYVKLFSLYQEAVKKYVQSYFCIQWSRYYCGFEMDAFADTESNIVTRDCGIAIV